MLKFTSSLFAFIVLSALGIIPLTIGEIHSDVVLGPNGTAHKIWQVVQDDHPTVYYQKGVLDDDRGDYRWGSAQSVVRNMPGFAPVPSIAVAPDGFVLLTWVGDDGRLYARRWDGASDSPANEPVDLDAGTASALAPDLASHFHIAYASNGQIKHCEWIDGACLPFTVYDGTDANRPEVRVYQSQAVRVVWMVGHRIYSRERDVDGQWGGIVFGDPEPYPDVQAYLPIAAH